MESLKNVPSATEHFLEKNVLTSTKGTEGFSKGLLTLFAIAHRFVSCVGEQLKIFPNIFVDTALVVTAKLFAIFRPTNVL